MGSERDICESRLGVCTPSEYDEFLVRQSQNATKPRDSDIHVKAEVRTSHGLWFGASRLGSERDICESRLGVCTPPEYDNSSCRQIRNTTESRENDIPIKIEAHILHEPWFDASSPSSERDIHGISLEAHGYRSIARFLVSKEPKRNKAA